MLRLSLDIVPFGIEDASRPIGMLEIARTSLRDNPETYRVHIYASDGELVNIYPVKGHYYEAGAWELCRRALEILVLPEAY